MAAGMLHALGLTLFFLSYQPLKANTPEISPEECGPLEAAADDECLAGGGEAGSECTLTALQRRALRLTSADGSTEEASREAQAAAAQAKAEARAEALVEEATRAYSEHNNAALVELGVRFNASGMAYNLMKLGAPKTALGYDGKAWPHMVVSGRSPHHIFAIGDWGGMDGAFEPGGGHHRIISYRGGHKPGPHVFPRTRFNREHTEIICNHTDFVECYQPSSLGCPKECGFVPGVDDNAQRLVANAFNHRASGHKPKLVLNVGDNFYYGGLEVDCGTPMGSSSLAQTHQFNSIFNGVYGGAAPWISALGNHDWGGWMFTNGWDQQIAYTWKSGRWVMPASYYSQHVIFEDSGFTMDIFVLDSNHQDAKPPPEDHKHNICSEKHNHPGASCPGGPPSVDACNGWFQSRWGVQQSWLSQLLAKSRADWQVAVTHFPCGTDSGFWMKMHKQFGLDLLVTGHRHDQELWAPGRLGGLTCFVTGGGGGISSEASPAKEAKDMWYGEGQYGFYDLTVTKDEIFIESISFTGKTVKSAKVSRSGGSAPAGAAGGGGWSGAHPGDGQHSGDGAAGSHAGGGRGQGAASCAQFGCGGFVHGRPCQCNSQCKQYNSCCHDYASHCGAASGGQAAGGGQAAQPPAHSCASYGCGGFQWGRPCQCNDRCTKHNNCCSDYHSKCHR